MYPNQDHSWPGIYQIVIVLLLALVILLGLFFFSYRPYQPSERTYQLPPIEITAAEVQTLTRNEIFTAINQIRAEHRVPELQLEDRLATAAQAKLNDMCARQYWSHTGPEGTEPWDWITEAGYVYTTAGENLGRNFLSIDELIQAWLVSPSHKENILNPTYTQTGVALRKCELNNEKSYVVVQLFATPGTSSMSPNPPPY